MAFIPQAKIYQTDGLALVYDIGDMLIGSTGWPDTDSPKQITLSNLRSSGEIVIPGGTDASDIIIIGRLTASNYTDLISAWDSLQSTIVSNTPYYLKIDKSAILTDDLKVIRKEKISIVNTNNWNSWIYYQIIFRNRAWS